MENQTESGRVDRLYGNKKIEVSLRDGGKEVVEVKSLVSRLLFEYIEIADDDDQVVKLCTPMTLEERDKLTDEAIEEVADLARDLNFDRAVRKAERRVKTAERTAEGMQSVMSALWSLLPKAWKAKIPEVVAS